MTLGQHADLQRIASLKSRSAADELLFLGYKKQYATETLPALPKGSNGPAGVAPDKF